MKVSNGMKQVQIQCIYSSRDKCRSSECFERIFPIRTDYGDLWRKCVYFVPIPENTDQKIYEFGPFHTVLLVVSPLNNEKY